jgi:hypothetical protein
VRRAVHGVTAVLLVAVLATGCGNSSGAARPSSSATTAAPTGLATQVVVPTGYVEPQSADPRERSGPFDARSFVATLSPAPPEDKALLLNAGFTEGFHAFWTSPDHRKQLTVQLFKAASPTKAEGLKHGFWDRDDHGVRFAVPGVPGAMSGAKVSVTANPGRSEATAEVTFVVGELVVEIGVRELGQTGSSLTPDITVVAKLAKQQKTRLTR